MEADTDMLTGRVGMAKAGGAGASPRESSPSEVDRLKKQPSPRRRRRREANNLIGGLGKKVWGFGGKKCAGKLGVWGEKKVQEGKCWRKKDCQRKGIM